MEADVDYLLGNSRTADSSGADGALVSEVTLARFVEAFESCALKKESWTHAAHVAVATVYLWQDRDTALPRIRGNIRRFNESVGGINSDTSGYHETLTVFWLNVLAAYLTEMSPRSHLEAVKNAVARFGDNSKLHVKFYSFDVVNCTQARRWWRAPDALPLQEIIPAGPSQDG